MSSTYTASGNVLIPTDSSLPVIKIQGIMKSGDFVFDPVKFSNDLNTVMTLYPSVYTKLSAFSSEGMIINLLTKLEQNNFAPIKGGSYVAAYAAYPGAVSVKGNQSFINSSALFELKTDVNLDYLASNKNYESLALTLIHEVVDHAKNGRHIWDDPLHRFLPNPSQILQDPGYQTVIYGGSKLGFAEIQARPSGALFKLSRWRMALRRCLRNPILLLGSLCVALLATDAGEAKPFRLKDLAFLAPQGTVNGRCNLLGWDPEAISAVLLSKDVAAAKREIGPLDLDCAFSGSRIKRRWQGLAAPIEEYLLLAQRIARADDDIVKINDAVLDYLNSGSFERARQAKFADPMFLLGAIYHRNKEYKCALDLFFLSNEFGIIEDIQGADFVLLSVKMTTKDSNTIPCPNI